jgi:tetratricopeptide repeat protein 30
LALAESVSKQMVVLKDSTFKEIFLFFDQCDKHGKNIPTVINHLPEELGGIEKSSTVSEEARRMKAIYLKLRDM